jgi:hypothetical protein
MKQLRQQKVITRTLARKQNKPKTCKLLVNSILALANHCSYKDYFATTIEWE